MFIATFCDQARSKLASGKGSASADPWRKSTRSDSPTRPVRASAVATNSGVRSIPLTRQPNLAARYRDGPPIPDPMSSTWSVAAGASMRASSSVALRRRE